MLGSPPLRRMFGDVVHLFPSTFDPRRFGAGYGFVRVSLGEEVGRIEHTNAITLTESSVVRFGRIQYTRIASTTIARPIALAPISTSTTFLPLSFDSIFATQV